MPTDAQWPPGNARPCAVEHGVELQPAPRRGPAVAIPVAAS